MIHKTKKIFCCEKYDPFERMMQPKFKKKDHMDDIAAVIGSDFNFAMSQWIRSAFTKSTTTQIRRHVQINQSCVISASLRMFHFGWIFCFFTLSLEETSTVWLTYSNFMHLEFGRGHVNAKRTRDNKF